MTIPLAVLLGFAAALLAAGATGTHPANWVSVLCAFITGGFTLAATRARGRIGTLEDKVKRCEEDRAALAQKVEGRADLEARVKALEERVK